MVLRAERRAPESYEWDCSQPILFKTACQVITWHTMQRLECSTATGLLHLEGLSKVHISPALLYLSR